MNGKVECARMSSVESQDLIESLRRLECAWKWRAIALPVGPCGMSHKRVYVQVRCFEILWKLLVRLASCFDVLCVSQVAVQITLAVVSHRQSFDQCLFHRSASARVRT